MGRLLWHICPSCSKRAYETRKMAKAAVHALKRKGRRCDPRPDDALGVYEACDGQGWHVGHRKPCAILNPSRAPRQWGRGHVAGQQGAD